LSAAPGAGQTFGAFPEKPDGEGDEVMKGIAAQLWDSRDQAIRFSH
jgi:hypothetical protein